MAAMQNFLLAFSLTVIKTTGARNMKFCMMLFVNMPTNYV